ncbi:MAG: fibronectin type III domain-containing protein [Patescibacteria group bacterium]|nr:fibronectin type III domain-containing protein [Patescibacteria group bacterium]
MKKILASIAILSFVFLITSVINAAPSDGLGPWADEVVSYSQGLMKNGQPVPPARSNPQAAVGPAENSNLDGLFFSLGFGGNIVLRFDNGVRDGVIVVESTWPNYPDERARVEVSQDGTNWVLAGTVVQDGQVGMPDGIACVNYVRITDISNPNDFPDDIADGYDVDGVRAVNAEPCGSTGGGPTSTPTPSPTGSIISTPTPTSQPTSSNNSTGSGSSSGSNSSQCTAGKPQNAPTITSITRTSPTTVSISWIAVSPVTTYALSYGISPGNYQYGVPSTGNVTSFVVGGLDPNAIYYFQVRGINDCMPGDPSGERAAGGGQVLGVSTGGGQVLGASTDVLGATGNFDRKIAISISLLFGVLSYGIYKKFLPE